MENLERPNGRSLRGFASMDKEKQRNIASKGGRAAHEKGTAHEFTPEEARVAGRKGGLARAMNRSKAASNGDSQDSSETSPSLSYHNPAEVAPPMLGAPQSPA